MTSTKESRPGRDSGTAVDLDDTQSLASVTDKIRAMARRSAAAAPPLTTAQARFLGTVLSFDSGGGSS